MAASTVIPDGQVPDEWAQHMGIIRRLYLDEEMTLQEVMRIMASEYGFVASYGHLSTSTRDWKLTVIRVKMYKKRLRDCNLRKNIRSTKSEAQAYQQIFNSRELPAQIRLSNGQVVETDHLATHIQRKMNRVRAPAMVRAPDRYHFMESAYLHTRVYLVSHPLPRINCFGRC